MKGRESQGLKPGSFCGSYGTTKVVPCYKNGWIGIFSASCEAVPLPSCAFLQPPVNAR
jgi:hypothetical protein